MNNDRFKFRVWDKVDNSWTHNEHIFLASTGKLLVAVATPMWAKEWSPTPDPDRFELVQCTGLKDKKGVLIYEGDVLLDGDDDGYIGVVRWDDGCAQFIVWFDECDRESPICWDDLEIIGHILENPALLEEK
jgi:uncharacterized phage protein (TIGR01671 family)